VQAAFEVRRSSNSQLRKSPRARPKSASRRRAWMQSPIERIRADASKRLINCEYYVNNVGRKNFTGFVGRSRSDERMAFGCALGAILTAGVLRGDSSLP
jgi:hypothetical protein